MKDVLHIYSPSCWHDEAFIVGDEESLTKLRDAIDKALQNPKQGTFESYTSDGEGFHCFVIRQEEVEDSLMLPYTDEMARSGGGQHPATLVKK